MKTIIFTLALTLAGCGGSTAPVATPAPQPLTIAQYGDSFVYGWTCINGVYSQSNPTEEIASQIALGQSYVTITNHGNGGSTAGEWLNGDTSGDIQFPIKNTWSETMASEPAQVVIILTGWNDAAVKHTSPDQFIANIDGLVRGVIAAGKTPIIETTSPADRADLIGEETDIVEQYVSLELAYAQSHGVFVIDTWDYIQQNYGAAWNNYISDGIHPTTAGYQIKGEFQAKMLRQFLTERGYQVEGQ